MRRAFAGFTFIELMVTVAIVSVLAMMALPLAEHSAVREHELELRRALREIRTALDAYKAAADSGEITLPAGSSGYPRTLAELVDGVPSVTKAGAKRYFLRRIPRDPFATDASVSADKTWGLRSYASPPDAPRVGDDVFDVYSLSTASGTNGVPYQKW